MTKEQAYERLELPIGCDLQIVRQKFSAMHNDYRMQIDNAFNSNSKRIFEQKLEELKEAYATLNESEGMDDSADLPRVGKSFDEGYSKNDSNDVQNDFEEKWNVETALALFGLSPHQGADVIEKGIHNYLIELKHQFQQAKLPAIQHVYQQEILKAKAAQEYLFNWLNEKKERQFEPSAFKQTLITEDTDVQSQYQPKWLYMLIKVMLIIAVVVMVLQLVVGPGRDMGGIATIFWWMISTITSSAIILNIFSSPLVPPYLRGRWFKGFYGFFTALLLMFGGAGFVALMYTLGAYREQNPWIYWNVYEEMSFLFLGILVFIWFIIIVTSTIIGIANPSFFFFKQRRIVAAVVAMMFIFQPFLLGSLKSGVRFANFGENRHIDNQEEFNESDGFYEDVSIDSVQLSEIEILTKSAEEGDAEAQFNLGYKYANGDQVDKDDTQAVFWYQKSVDQGYAPAQVELAWNYDHGLGVKKNVKKAHELYSMAAEQGNAAGQYYVGWNYINGVGVGTNRQKGISWWKKSASQGHEEAINDLKELGITDYD